jgi:hypothetical protein
MAHSHLVSPRLALIAAALAFVGCDLPTDDDDTAGADPSTTGAPSGDTGDAPGSDGGDADSSDGGGDSSDGDSSGTGEPGDGDGVLTCTQGRLYLGSPHGDPSLSPSDGSAMIDATDNGPSLAARRIVADPTDPSRKMVAAGSELWSIDEASGTLHHVLGDEDAGDFAAGPCATARIGGVSDMVFRSDGTLYLGDHMGNAVVEVTDPFGAGCQMHYYAGTQTNVSTSPVPHEPGFDDGPVASATFAGPDFLAVDENDAIYVVDLGNRAVRMIDAADQVSTIAELPDDYVTISLAAFGIVAADNGMLYMPVKGSVESSQNATILEIDPADGALREVATGRDDPWLVGSSGPTIAGLVQADTGLLATYVNGRIFTVGMADGAVTHVAGDGDKPWAMADYDSGYDPFAPYAAMDLELDNHQATTAGAAGFLTLADGELYFSGLAEGYVVTQIDCE